MKNSIIEINKIESKIYIIRNQQVMLDRDLALLYDVNTGRINEQVKRNIKRFDDDFMFQLTKNEVDNLISQNATSSWGGIRKLPFAFTEQGVYMLATVLKSDTAIETSKQIMRTFTKMKSFLLSNNAIFQRFERIENRLLSHDDNFKQLFKALEEKNKTPNQLIFHNGSYFDAHSFISDIIKSAKKSITLIDNYIDNTTLLMLSQNPSVDISLYSHSFSKQLKSSIEKYNKQYKPLKTFANRTFHDRYLIIDGKKVYNIGASLKDAGHKTFNINLMSDFSERDIFSHA